MGDLALLIVYTIVIGVLELQFGFTVGDVLRNLVALLTGGR